MEKISGPIGGFKVEAYTAKTDRGYLGLARVVRSAGPAEGPDVVVDRLGIGPLASEQQALEIASRKAETEILRRIFDAMACK
ncbi:MAG TPA: hypothetical protein VFE82_11565 [Ramlibacter sp.]|jgi:hypothetical protein|uniref:hypothetical protein n=1 Tax=Ramlibacter sp. TaxID=1917967 RepID=UPI002D69B233|nr:hypothetical protein [Ramlibacter sp.]HZY19109.1 hypothetical protein [Ramlibacter sp.]